MKKSFSSNPMPQEASHSDPMDIQTEIGPPDPAAAHELFNRHLTPPAIPDHQLISCIGRGSYGEVWLARNVMGVYRAVKIVYRDAFETNRPYEREYQGIRKFEPISRRHESQVDILHVGRNDTTGYFYYVMELADAVEPQANRSGISPDAPLLANVDPATYQPRTLRSELKRRGHLPFDECLEIALSLTTALQHLHAHGLIHRDIKPANIIFVEALPKLADIGLVTETGQTLTFVGTEGYLPPEGPGSVQADIFSLGKVLYELCTGKDRLEFPEMPTFIDTLPDKNRLFEFNEVLLKACEQDLGKRYATAAQMHEDLLLLKAGKSVRRSHLVERRLALAMKLAALLTAVGLLTATALFYQRMQTAKARRLADENRRALQHLEFQRAHEQFERNQSSLALAYLARALRRDPANRLAGERLLSALTHRQHALPRFELAHQSKAVAARFSPDASRIVTAARDGQARVWEAATGKLLFQLRHERELADARFSHLSRWILTRDLNGTVQVWDAHTRQAAAPPISHPGAILAEFSPDDGRVATGGQDGLVRIWDRNTSEPIGAPLDAGAALGPFQDGRLSSELEFSPDGTRLVTVTTDQRVAVWEIASARKLFALPRGHTMDLSPDGSKLAMAYVLEARVWDARSGTPISRPLPHKFPIRSVRFSPDGRRVVTASNDQTARIWDAESGLPLAPPLSHGDGVLHAEFSANGERLLTWSQDGHIRLWNAYTGELAAEPAFANLDLDTSYVQLSPDERWVLAFSGSTVRLWDIRYGALLPLTIQPEIDSEPLHDNFMGLAHFDSRGEKVLTANSGIIQSPGWVRWNMTKAQSPSVLRVWSAATGRPISPSVKHENSLSSAVFSLDGRSVVSASEDGIVLVWNAETGELRTAPLRHGAAVRSACVSGDGRLVATACLDGLLRIWDVHKGQVLHSFRQSDPVQLPNALRNRSLIVRFSPDGSLLLSSFQLKPNGADQELATTRIWNVNTGTLQAVLPETGLVYHAAFSPDSTRVVTAAIDQARARLWDAKSGDAITDWLRHQGAVNFAEFSPDGQRVVTCSTDRSARIWDSRSGRLLAAPLKHGWEVMTARFSPDGSRVVTASWDQTAQIWDASTGLPVSEPIKHWDWVHGAEFSPDGHCILTAMVRQNAQIWEAITPTLPVPEWLPRLAEVLAGQRLDNDDNLHRVAWNEPLELLSELASLPSMAPLDRWVHWFLANRETRQISPSGSITVAEHVQRRMADDSLESLTEVLRLDPLNPKILSRLGRKLMIASRTRVTHRDRAEWLTRLALHLAPEDSSAWWLRADVLRALDQLDEANLALGKALDTDPGNLNALFLKALLQHRSGDLDAAYQSYVNVLHRVVESDPRQDSVQSDYIHEGLRELRALGRLDRKTLLELSERKRLRHGTYHEIEADWLVRTAEVSR